MATNKAILFVLAMISIICEANEQDDSSLSYSFFGIGQESIFYQETSSDFAGESFQSDFNASGFFQVSGGFTQFDPSWGFTISTTSTLIPKETTESWSFDGFGIVQQDTMTLTQNKLDLKMSFLGLPHGQFISSGMRYQNIAFSRFNFRGAGNIDALNAAIISTLEADPTSNYSTIKTYIENYVGDTSNGIPYPDADGELLQDADGNLITSVDDLTNAVVMRPEETQGVVFEDSTSIVFSLGYGVDSFLNLEHEGLRYRAGIEVGIPMYISVLNTNNDTTLSEYWPEGIDVLAHIGIGYQFAKSVGLLLEYQYAHSERGEIIGSLSGADEIRLPKNTFQSHNISTQFYWAF